mmetsp:Transcript_31198/g.93533  ORF Transcript_31198/g.93533 Transcript_31198/m.93533 type:complete len:270 (-) Transcript_31198:1430-2239(-)
MIRASLSAAARATTRPKLSAAKAVAESASRAASTLSTSSSATSALSAPPTDRRRELSTLPRFLSPDTAARLPFPPLGPSLSTARPFSAEAKTDESSPSDDSAASSASKNKERIKEMRSKKKKKSLEETVNRLKSKDGEGEGDEGPGGASTDDAAREAYHKANSVASSFLSGLSSTWQELLNSGKPQSINKVIHDPLKEGETADDDDAAADKYEGTTALMYIDPEEHLSAWERMQRRLNETPIISGEFLEDRLCVCGCRGLPSWDSLRLI